MEHPAQILKKLRGQARKRFGQHFLASEGVVDQIVATAQVAAGDRVLEIGPGLGVMTDKLLHAGAAVTAVELDRDLAAYLTERFPDIRLVQGDAAKQDWDAILEGDGWKCVSNLPYNVGTRIVTQLVKRPQTFSRLVVMVQKEVAERMVAPAGERKRGSLSVHMEAYARCRLAIRVKPGAFHPPPKVDSAVVDIRLHPAPLLGGVEPAFFEEVVRVGFSSPRKAVHNPLGRVFGKADVKSALGDAGVKPMARPGTLALEEWSRVAAILQEQRNTT